MQNLTQIVSEIEGKIPQNKLSNWYDVYIGESEEGNEGFVDIGQILPIDDSDFVIYAMNEWVRLQDDFIAQIREKEDPFLSALAFSQRGFTYEEFKFVMSGKHPERYEDYKVFSYLHIINKESQNYFIATNKDEEKNDMELYLERVERFAKLEIPALKTFFFSYRRKRFPMKALKRHAYILGGTGSGKSEVIKYLHYGLWNESKERKNRSIISIEPHGKLSRELLQFNLTYENPERVIYLDTNLRETARKLCGYDVLKDDYTFVFNPFDLPQRTPSNVNYMTQEISSAFFEILKEEGSPQMKSLVKACVSTLLVNEGMSINELQRFMDDESNRELVELGLRNPNEKHREFFKRFDMSTLKATKSGIYFRLQNLIDDVHFLRMMRGKSTINIETAINTGKVIICNLSKGQMGKESAPTLGKLVVALIQGYAMKRESSKTTNYKPTFLFLDEVQNYITPSIEQIMTESRKYGLHLILANQILGQNMTSEMKRIILSNTALKFCGDNDPDSIKGMADTMGLKVRDFDKLKKHHFYAYNKLNKKQGAKMTKVPPTLVNVKQPYYMSRKNLAEYFLQLANDSGYYVKSSALEKTQRSKAVLREKNASNGNQKSIYKNDFID